MIIARMLPTGEIFEHKFGSTLVDKNGVSHPWGITDTWSAMELYEVGLFRVEEMELPEGFRWLEGKTPTLKFDNTLFKVWLDYEGCYDLIPPPPPEPEPEPVPTKQEKQLKFIKTLGIDPTEEELPEIQKLIHSDARFTPIGYFGKIWVRELHLPKKGDYHQGHKHTYDHITLVAQGSVLCEVEGQPPKKFVSPTFITIRADDWHKFTALQDNTTYYCIYAIRNAQGEVVDGNDKDLFTEDNSPYKAFDMKPITKEEIQSRLAGMDVACAHCDCDK